MAETLDIKQAAEAACHDKCENTWAIYKACEKRLADHNIKDKDCSGYYTEHWACIDRCAYPLYWYKIK